MNETLFYFFNNFALQNEIFDTLIIFVADWLLWWLLIALFFLAIYKKIAWKQVFHIIGVALLAWLATQIIKYFYFSPRPFLELENLKLLFTHGANDSFPSGHTAFAFALATMTYFFNKKTGLIFFICALLIGLSRVVAGVHWPLDILAGILLGGALACFLSSTCRRHRPAIDEKRKNC